MLHNRFSEMNLPPHDVYKRFNKQNILSTQTDEKRRLRHVRSERLTIATEMIVNTAFRPLLSRTAYFADAQPQQQYDVYKRFNKQNVLSTQTDEK